MLFKQNSKPLTSLSWERRWLIFNINWKRHWKGKLKLFPVPCPLLETLLLQRFRWWGHAPCSAAWWKQSGMAKTSTHILAAYAAFCLLVLFTCFSFAGRLEMGTNRQWPPHPKTSTVNSHLKQDNKNIVWRGEFTSITGPEFFSHNTFLVSLRCSPVIRAASDMTLSLRNRDWKTKLYLYISLNSVLSFFFYFISLCFPISCFRYVWWSKIGIRWKWNRPPPTCLWPWCQRLYKVFVRNKYLQKTRSSNVWFLCDILEVLWMGIYHCDRSKTKLRWEKYLRGKEEVDLYSSFRETAKHNLLKIKVTSVQNVLVS